VKRKPDRLAHLVSELTGLNVDIIVAAGNSAVHAVKEATRTIPIVMRYDGDPVRAGVVARLVRPGGNSTGLASITQQLNGKRFELLAEVVPEAKRIGVLADRTDQARYMATRLYKDLEAAARALGVKPTENMSSHTRQSIACRPSISRAYSSRMEALRPTVQTLPTNSPRSDFCG
jgi:putative ABC transport system substrate-binding protein